MLRSNRRLKSTVAALVALAAFAAISVSPAAAESVTAKFSGTTLKLSGSSYTLKKGTETKTCTLGGGSASSEISSNTFWLRNLSGQLGDTGFSCSGSYFGLQWQGAAKYDTVTGQYSLVDLSAGSQEISPWGTYGTVEWNAPWTNGSGTTNSTVTLNEVVVGKLFAGAESLKLSGTFTATTSSGGLITLSH